jgi:pimeloyl-ACP methyl ester carboxylesterase
MAVFALSKKSTTVRKIATLATLRLMFSTTGWLLPELAVRRAFRLFGTPMPLSRHRAHQTELAGAEVVPLTIGREQIITYRWGNLSREPVVLLVHGWSDFGLRFLPWIAALRRAGYAVVSFDQVGHGRSSGRWASLPIFADTVSQVAARLGPLAAVVGHSLGAAATAVAMARGLDAQRVVLISPPADPVEAARRFASVVGLRSSLALRMMDEFETLMGVPVASFMAQSTAPAIARPGLVIHDLADTEVPWEEGERYARYWPQARMLNTEGLGHYRIARDPGVITAAIDFLQGHVRGEQLVSTRDLPYGVA